MQITKENRVLMKFIEIQEYSEQFSQKRDQKGTTFLPKKGPKRDQKCQKRGPPAFLNVKP